MGNKIIYFAADWFYQINDFFNNKFFDFQSLAVRS